MCGKYSSLGRVDCRRTPRVDMVRLSHRACEVTRCRLTGAASGQANEPNRSAFGEAGALRVNFTSVIDVSHGNVDEELVPDFNW